MANKELEGTIMENTIHAKLEIKQWEKILKEHPHLPKRVEVTINLYIRMYQGDADALMKLMLMQKLITLEEYNEYERLDI